MAVAAVAAARPGTAFAHVRPQTESPQPNARLDAPPAHIVIDYDGAVDPKGTNVLLLDAGGNARPIATDPFPNDRTGSFTPMTALAPGPHRVDRATLDPSDGHMAQGFYIFVVDGGPVGILQGSSQSRAPAADPMATLTVTTADDGSSLLRVDLDNAAGVEPLNSAWAVAAPAPSPANTVTTASTTTKCATNMRKSLRKKDG